MLNNNEINNNKNYIDIHSHILPGIDDGAKDETESLEMLKIAAEAGVRAVIATPHFHYRRGHATPAQVKTTALKMQELLDERNIPLQIYTGNELYYTHELVEIVKAGEALTMADSDYVLLEFSVGTDRRKIQNAVYQFLCEGYNPIIAHIERYAAFQKHPEFVGEIYEMGAYYQVNADSLYGNASWNVKRFTKKLIKNDNVAFLATDAHDSVQRSPKFEKALEWIAKKYGEAQIEEYLIGNPNKILKNETI